MLPIKGLLGGIKHFSTTMTTRNQICSSAACGASRGKFAVGDAQYGLRFVLRHFQSAVHNHSVLEISDIFSTVSVVKLTKNVLISEKIEYKGVSE
jgi:hypothetical protein